MEPFAFDESWQIIRQVFPPDLEAIARQAVVSPGTNGHLLHLHRLPPGLCFARFFSSG
jgi:hypothetical protein